MRRSPGFVGAVVPGLSGRRGPRYTAVVLRDLLDDRQLAEASEALTDWSVGPDALERTFRFRSFVEAFSFMAGAALHAERLDHHPEWRNVYGTVEVRLTTHDAGGVTGLDVELARAMDALAASS